MGIVWGEVIGNGFDFENDVAIAMGIELMEPHGIIPGIGLNHTSTGNIVLIQIDVGMENDLEFVIDSELGG